jgi:hypothetical protein
VDVTRWLRHEEFEYYPEGTRVKVLMYCPAVLPFDFLKSSHRYLFKSSSKRYPEQYWVEIFAYRLAGYMNIEVPPAFAAYDTNTGESAALIEWFFRPSLDVYVGGGDFLDNLIKNFNRKTGVQHNIDSVFNVFLSLEDYCSVNNWKEHWAKTFLFDTLIGNTDRHQDNWGIIFIDAHSYSSLPSGAKVSTSPAFDNGTSMGHEIFSSKFKEYKNQDVIQRYVAKGKHHMKWNLKDIDRIQHAEMLVKIAGGYPETRHIMLDCLSKVNDKIFENILDDLVKFDIPVKLTQERMEFMFRLISFRYHQLLNRLAL